MDNKLNFGNLIAHFIPGLLSFFIFLNSNLRSKYIIPDNFSIWFGKNEIFSSTIIIAIALALGLCIDSFRYLITYLVLKCKKDKNWCSFKIVPPEKNEIQRYNWIVENHYRYHQFCGNLSIVILIAIILLKGKYPVWPFWILWVILTFSAICIFRKTVLCFKEAFPKDQKEVL